MSTLLNKIMGRSENRAATHRGGVTVKEPTKRETGLSTADGPFEQDSGYDPYDAPGWRPLAITVRGSVESVLPVAEVERLVSDALSDLADEHGVTLDEITVREGDGL